ncbi:DUF7096 domain-containing protein [Halorussus salinus]|uniref:DUF7096 domain-containing protein n=1 Tax=Halorussus salinus TaxID=1364935 RepID=UPI001092F13B|nr:hypothetical protein [Halorussus salinus]
MSPYRAVLLALFVVGGALVAAVPTGATAPASEGTTHAADAPTPEVAEPTRVGGGLTDAQPTSVAADATAANDTSTANDTTANSSLGTDISSFMQSSAAEVGGAVETGMWSAAFNATDNESVRAELVETKTSDLREELADLRERRAELVAEREAGNLSRTAYKAKVSRLVGEINALRSAIDSTTNRAESVNANVETLGSLRSETDNLTSPEIAAVARNVTGVGVGNGQRGPPSGVGEGNGNGVGEGNGNGVGAGNGNGAGEGNGVGEGNGNGVGAGNGNDAASAAEEAANGTTPGEAGEGNAAGNGAANGNGNPGESGANGDDAGKSKGLSDAGNETGVGNGNSPNGTDGTRGQPSGADDSPTTTPEFVNRVSTALVAGTGSLADGGFTAF